MSRRTSASRRFAVARVNRRASWLGGYMGTRGMGHHSMTADVAARALNAPSLDDHSGTFKTVRADLVHADGRRYLDFVRALKPSYARVWADIALGYALLIAGCIAIVAAANSGCHPGVIAILGALHIGYWVAYLQLFIHEGAHSNLAADRTTSDRIADGLIGWMIGTTVQNYRVVHFQHHRALGSVDDSEFSYFVPFNLMFIAKGLAGIRVIEVLQARRRYASTGRPKQKAAAAPASSGLGYALMGVAVHLAIMAALWVTGGFPAALAWVLGVSSVFPLFGALRQLLEHRDDHADNSADYARTNHGAFTRVFGSGPLSATFGGAGFNRHLLHHWEPQVSYTNLADLERFLLGTAMRPVIDARRATYGGTALKLLSLR